MGVLYSALKEDTGKLQAAFAKASVPKDSRARAARTSIIYDNVD